MRINTNIQAMTASRLLSASTAAQSRAAERLATGLRIPRARDDPSGLIASELLRADLRRLEARGRVMLRIDSVLSVAEGGLAEVSDLLAQAEAIAVSYANTGAGTDDERQGLQIELESILNTLDRIASTTRFNGQKLLDGSASFSFEGGGVSLLNVSARGLGLGSIDLRDGRMAQDKLRAATKTVASARGLVGSFQRFSLGPQLRVNTVTIENIAAMESFIRDADLAVETSELARAQILGSASTLAMQIALQRPNQALELIRGILRAP